MNKKFLSAILFGALTVASTSTFVSCKDYDDDIDNLQMQITANADAIAQIQALLDKGVVITNVEKTAEGITLTLSNGTTQVLTNGQDGKDADVWTIGADGYWYKNGTLTEYKAKGDQGEKGETGAQGEKGDKGDKGDTGATGAAGAAGAQGPAGADGKDGKDGANGKDGGYYVPNATTGNFDYVDADGNKKDSGISWKSSVMTAVKTDAGIIFSGIEGYPDGFTLSTIAELKSLVFKPQLVVDGVNAINAGVLTFNNKIICTPNVTAEYHLNPSTVNENGIDKASLKYVAMTKDYVVTRAISDVKASYNKIANGLLTVNVDFAGTPSTGTKIDLIALQATNKVGEVITSDYATVATDPLKAEDLYPSRKEYIKNLGDNAHFWAKEADAKDVAKNDAAVNETKDQDKRIITVVYNETIDLDDYVKTCFKNGNNHSEFTQMADYHLSYRYSNVSFVLTGMENGLKVTTDQSKFIKLDAATGVVTPTTYTDGDQLRSSIGRTPVIKIELIHQEEGGQATVLKTAYAVLEIVDADEPIITEKKEVHPYDVTVDKAFTDYDFCNAEAEQITAQQMNSVYSGEKVSKEEFENNFTFVPSGTKVTIDGKTYESSNTVSIEANAGQITTYGLTWTLDAAYKWNNAGKTPAAVAVYKHNKKELYVVLNLKAANALATNDNVTFPAGDKFAEMWNADQTLGLFNVRVPNTGESTTDQCTFVNDLLTLYLQNADPVTKVKAAINKSNYKVSAASGVSAVDVKYVIKSAKCTGQKTSGTFKVSTDGTKLYYVVSTVEHLVATLNGTEVTLNSDHDNNAIAEELLNTNNLVVTYGIDAKFTSCLGEKAVPATGATTFDVRYVRPINVNPESVGEFQDGNDFGGNGTLLEAASVISLQDWRGNAVVSGNSYYGYYGITRVTVDNKGVTCNLKSGKNQKLPSTIKAGIVDAASLADPDLATGLNGKNIDEWFYYKNNGTVLQEDIEINFPVIVEYYWGKVETQTVTVKVKKTNNIN